MLPYAKSFKSAIYLIKFLQISKSFSIKPASGVHQWKYCEKSASVFVQSLYFP